ncbi:DUF6445 family protein [Streptosporangium roseum]|uniref:DUF6445 family protein n=1 Tax=Streptosporangium roseum TaxID=2001 RepID=UPI00068AD976|nr:DUF6445 family protein [Streptosporangium roseum]
MRSRFIVIDDFYSDPDAVRAAAVQCSFTSMGRYNYPGWQGSRALTSAAIWTAFEQAIGADLVRDETGKAFGAFRLISEESGQAPKIHADSQSDWAGLVYLTPNAPASCGTGFYRHRKTGLSGPPVRREPAGGSWDLDRIFRGEMADAAKWELIGQVAPVYNRLLLFRGRELFHAPLGGQGTRPEDFRLTQIFFFDEVRRAVPPLTPAGTGNRSGAGT